MHVKLAWTHIGVIKIFSYTKIHASKIRRIVLEVQDFLVAFEVVQAFEEGPVLWQ